LFLLEVEEALYSASVERAEDGRGVFSVSLKCSALNKPSGAVKVGVGVSLVLVRQRIVLISFTYDFIISVPVYVLFGKSFCVVNELFGQLGKKIEQLMTRLLNAIHYFFGKYFQFTQLIRLKDLRFKLEAL
jgi:hypothetical protein